MKKKNIISVVLATYNGERFLREQLESLKNQTRQPDEVIVADDGSTDHTTEIVANYISQNKLSDSWRVLLNQKNKGYALNFFDMTCLAIGNIVFFSDQDDVWDKHKIENMERILDLNPNIDVLASDLEIFYSGKNASVWEKKDLETMSNSGELEYIRLTKKNLVCQRSACTMAIRKNYWNKICAYWTPHWAHDDFVWKCGVIDGKCAIYHYKSINRRLHENNTTNIKIRTKNSRVEQIENIINEYLSLVNYTKINNNNLGENIVEQYLKCSKLRLNVIKNKSIISWIVLFLRYRYCFNNSKSMILDLYFVFFREHKNYK